MVGSHKAVHSRWYQPTRRRLSHRTYTPDTSANFACQLASTPVQTWFIWDHL